MSKSEYQELIEFLGEHFDRIDRRLAEFDNRLTRLEISHESMRDDVKGIAEGLMTLNQRFDRFETEVRGWFAEQDLQNVHVNLRLASIEKRLTAA
jgi:predicted nuclease with TOPRIM domain